MLKDFSFFHEAFHTQIYTIKSRWLYKTLCTKKNILFYFNELFMYFLYQTLIEFFTFLKRSEFGLLFDHFQDESLWAYGSLLHFLSLFLFDKQIIRGDTQYIVSAAILLVSLLSAIVLLPINKFMSSRYIALYLFALYVVYLVLSALHEADILVFWAVLVLAETSGHWNLCSVILYIHCIVCFTRGRHSCLFFFCFVFWDELMLEPVVTQCKCSHISIHEGYLCSYFLSPWIFFGLCVYTIHI